MPATCKLTVGMLTAPPRAPGLELPSRQSPASLFCRQGRGTPAPKHLVSQGSRVLTAYTALRLTAPPRTTCLHSRQGCCWGESREPGRAALMPRAPAQVER